MSITWQSLLRLLHNNRLYASELQGLVLGAIVNIDAEVQDEKDRGISQYLVDIAENWCAQAVNRELGIVYHH